MSHKICKNHLMQSANDTECRYCTNVKLQAEIEQLKEINESRGREMEDRLDTINKTQCEVHKVANLLHAEQEKSQAQAAEIERLKAENDNYSTENAALIQHQAGMVAKIKRLRKGLSRIESLPYLNPNAQAKVLAEQALKGEQDGPGNTID